MKDHVIRWKKGNKEFFIVMDKENLVEKIIQDIINVTDIEELTRIIQVSDDIFIDWDKTKETGNLKLYFWITDGSKGKKCIEHKPVIQLLKSICNDGNYIPDIFTMEWQIEGQKHKKTLERKQVENMFQVLLDGNPENNEISKRIVHILPMMQEAYINWDNTAKNNSLYYKTYDDSENYKGIEIISHHKKVWTELKKICDMV